MGSSWMLLENLDKRPEGLLPGCEDLWPYLSLTITSLKLMNVREDYIKHLFQISKLPVQWDGDKRN